MQRHVFYSLIRSGALLALFGFTTSSALGTGTSPMEGTWGGADAQGRTAQVTIVGNQVIGVFWGEDYHDAKNVRSSKNGARLDFTLDGAKATLVRDPRINLLYRAHNVTHIVGLERREMKAADNRMDFRNA